MLCARIFNQSYNKSNAQLNFGFHFASYFPERRLAEKGDNARERALMMMMQGRLEANPEDELKKDLVPPEFITNKPQDEWSEEEQKAAKDFEKKKQQLQEDREKYRKSLETELKKLQSGISDATASFDEKLSQLFQRKVKTEMVIYQVCFPQSCSYYFHTAKCKFILAHSWRVAEL